MPSKMLVIENSILLEAKEALLHARIDGADFISALGLSGVGLLVVYTNADSVVDLP